MKYVMLLMVLGLVGCTTAGPYVTNISSDGKGGIVVEKSSVEYNGITGTVGSKSDVSVMTIQVCPPIDK